MQLTFVLVDETTKGSNPPSPLAPEVTPDWLGKVAAAVGQQLNGHFSPHWGGEYSVRVGSSPSDIIKGEIVFAMVDALPDAPGAVAYHDVDGNDVPVAYLGLTTCNTLDDVSIAVSHECCETGGDAGCNLWADDGNGTEWAREACDAVESNNYDINGIKVSDFVLPSFFDANGKGPLSYLSTPTAPFQTAPGGYQIKRSGTFTDTQVTASDGSKRGARVVAGKHHWSSRPAKRGVAVGSK